MNVLVAILGSLGLVSLMVALVVLGQFGRKLGAVTKMRPFYLGYYVATVLVLVALMFRIVRTSVFWAPAGDIAPALNDPLFYLLVYHLPLAVGLTIGLVITWLYWNWLLKE